MRATTKEPLREAKSAWYSMPVSVHSGVRTIIVYRWPSPMALSTRPEYSPKLSDSSAAFMSFWSSATIRRPAGAKVSSSSAGTSPSARIFWPGTVPGVLGPAARGAKSHEATAEPRKVSKTRPTKMALSIFSVVLRFQ